jgi:phosphatidate cytidylyltransferase
MTQTPIVGPSTPPDPSVPPAASPASPAQSEFVRRLVSGIVMAAGALALTFAGGWWFAGLVTAGGVIMCWEWGRLVRGRADAVGGPDRLLLLHAASAVLTVVFTALGHPGWAVAVLGAAGLTLYNLDQARPLSAFGVAYVGLPALVLVWLRQEPGHGLSAVLYLFVAVWVTDIAAYAAGRTIGGPRLAPRISPGKTWSGLVGGVATSGLAGAAFGAYIPGASVLRLGVLAIVLAIAAQIGDLFESALKRRSGLKDASGIIPGHGGLLDRVDGLVAAVALVIVIVLLWHVDAPARGLILGR